MNIHHGSNEEEERKGEIKTCDFLCDLALVLLLFGKQEGANREGVGWLRGQRSFTK